MSGPLTEVGFRSMAQTITRLRNRNRELNLEVFRLRESRDEWKRKATARAHEVRNLRRQVERWKARAPEWRRPPVKRRRPTAAELAEHQRVLERILSIPVRKEPA